jgi:hypothetical protein
MSKPIWQPAVVLPVLVVAWLASRVLPGSVASPAAKLALALAILPAILYFILAQIRWNRAADELQQRILLQTYSGILAGVLAITFTLHSLQKAGFATRLDVIDGVALGGGIGALFAWISARRRFGAVGVN